MFFKDLKDFTLPKGEEEVLEYWKKNKIIEKSLRGESGIEVKKTNLKNKKLTKEKKFIFYEGPPTANGRPGIHHVLSRVFKDVILRHKTMQGYFVPRRAGWDTHGLPVEIEVEKNLGLKSKKEIEQYGIAAFNKKCRESVWKYKEEWERMTERMGFWLDLKNPYITYETKYVESLWWIIDQINKRKLLYKGHKVVPWCTRCGTALSSHELAQGYKEIEDNSVYVKFRVTKSKEQAAKIKSNLPIYILSWTTTPWTLPGNVALAVGEDIEYVIIENKNNSSFRIISQKEGKVIEDSSISSGIYILAKDIFWKNINSNSGLSEIRHLLNSSNEKIIEDLVVYASRPNDFLNKHGIKVIKGKDLIGLEYEPLFDIPGLKSKISYKIYGADFVTTTDGTGVVHTAVMYGEDDYVLGTKIGLPKYHTVEETGKFKKEVKGFGGLWVKDKQTEEKIFEYLKTKRFLWKTEVYKHEYPFCWRCSTPLLYYARDSWFVEMTKVKKKMLEANNTINWVPEHIKSGRFGGWLKELKDWNFSRERYWGTPLPVWECKKCDKFETIGGIKDLDLRTGKSRNNYIVMRHGQAETQILNIWDSGNQNMHLTDLGKEQVLATAKKLKKEKIQMIFSSDILRTKETSAIVTKTLGIKKVNFDKRLRELQVAEFSGKPGSEYAKKFPTYADSFAGKPDGGESLRDLRGRLNDFIEEVEKKYQGKNILIISHEWSVWMLTQAMEGWTEQEAIEQMERRERTFIKTGEARKQVLRILPKDETGEINLHRPYIDQIIFKCSKCKGEMKRIKELADVWFDSGSMPLAQEHYPFDQRQGTRDKANQLGGVDFPADYIAEAVDQTRGWFYTLLAVAVALGFKAPYKNVISLGHILDKHGQKMSKSKGNVVDPWMMAEKYGMDAVRWYFFTSSAPGEPRNFDEQEVLKTYRRFHLIIWNSLVFYRTYAGQVSTINHPSSTKVSEDRQVSGNILDQWILERLNGTIKLTTKYFEKYAIREAALEIEKLADDLSRWYIRRSRRRFQKSEDQKDFESAVLTLGLVLRQIAKLMAPFNPFFAEIIYSQLQGSIEADKRGKTINRSGFTQKESVHFEEWPSSWSVKRESRIIKDMEEIRRLAALGLAEREKAGIKVRQPLATLSVAAKSKEQIVNKQMLDILAEEVNVKEVILNAKIKGEVELDIRITDELKAEGIIRELTRMIQDLRQKAGLEAKDKIVLMFEMSDGLKKIVSIKEALLKKEVGAKEIEYRKSDKFDAEIQTKLEGEDLWAGVRKV